MLPLPIVLLYHYSTIQENNTRNIICFLLPTSQSLYNVKEAADSLRAYKHFSPLTGILVVSSRHTIQLILLTFLFILTRKK